MLGYGSVYDLLKLLMGVKATHVKSAWDNIREKLPPSVTSQKYQFDRKANGKVCRGAKFTPAASLDTLTEVVMLAPGQHAHKFRIQCIKLLRRVWEGDETLVDEIRANAAGASTSAPTPEEVLEQDSAASRAMVRRDASCTAVQRGIVWDDGDGAMVVAPSDIISTCGHQFLKVKSNELDAFVPAGYENVELFYILFHGFCTSLKMPLWELGCTKGYVNRSKDHRRTQFPTSRVTVLMATTGCPSRLIEDSAKTISFKTLLTKLDTNTETFFASKEVMLQRAQALYETNAHIVAKTFVDPELGLDAHPFVRPSCSSLADVVGMNENAEIVRIREETVRAQTAATLEHQTRQTKLDHEASIVKKKIDMLKELRVDGLITTQELMVELGKL
jgi:hypothetical protein